MSAKNWIVLGRVVGTLSAITCSVFVAVLFFIPSGAVSAAPGASPSGTPIPLSTIVGIISTIATMFGMTSVASFLGFFKQFIPVKSEPATTDPPKDGDKKSPEKTDVMNTVLDLGMMGYYATLYQKATDQGEKTKVREAASILDAKLFAEWFPESGANA